MAFTVPLMFEWLKHRLYATQRIILRRHALYFVEQSPSLIVLKDNYDKYILCPVCGFAMANLELKDAWSARACSATGFKNILNNQIFDKWLAEIIKNKQTAISDNNLSMKLK
jgi:hypothetical protein